MIGDQISWELYQAQAHLEKAHDAAPDFDLMWFVEEALGNVRSGLERLREIEQEENPPSEDRKGFRPNPLGVFVIEDVPHIAHSPIEIPPVKITGSPRRRALLALRKNAATGVSVIWGATITTVLLVISGVLLVLTRAGVIGW